MALGGLTSNRWVEVLQASTIIWISSMSRRPSAQKFMIGNRGRLPKMSKLTANMLKMTDSSSLWRSRKKRMRLRSPFRMRRKWAMISAYLMSKSPQSGMSLHHSKTTCTRWPSKESWNSSAALMTFCIRNRTCKWCRKTTWWLRWNLYPGNTRAAMLKRRQIRTVNRSVSPVIT